MSVENRRCLEVVYQAVGNCIYVNADASEFDAVGNALFCGKKGCTKVCDMSSSDENYTLYGDCYDVLEAERKKEKEKKITKSIEKVKKKTAEVVLWASGVMVQTEEKAPELIDPEASLLLHTLTEPRIPQNKIDEAALEASNRYKAMQLNHIDPEERLGDELFGAVQPKAVDEVLFKR